MEKSLFDDPRCDFEAGKIKLQTEFPIYEPGNVVKGKIYLDMKQEVKSNCIELILMGEESISFIYHIDPNNQLNYQIARENRKILEFSNSSIEVPGGVLPTGHLEVDFAFTLPNDIPASYFYRDEEHRNKPYA